MSSVCHSRSAPPKKRPVGKREIEQIAVVRKSALAPGRRLNRAARFCYS